MEFEEAAPQKAERRCSRRSRPREKAGVLEVFPPVRLKKRVGIKRKNTCPSCLASRNLALPAFFCMCGFLVAHWGGKHS
ncbi:hypothetical protein NPIL_399301 [Nephila pilipes]|uniref:Uncharacterized protein n=1 Tax=Nephila pilipes TaxID=299642 RepID=A0A8X6T709_NEPPI|nr:hypothetical protein NPIL_399301 [Nephila pilipes]